MSPDSKSGRVSRRKLVERAAVAASALPLMGSLLQAQAPAQPPAGAPGAAGGPPGAGRGRGGGRGPGPGGTGPIRVLFISRFHPFNREPLFLTLDSFGKDITWTHVEHPAAEVFFSPETSKNFDVFLLYDAFAGQERHQKPDGTFETVNTVPTPELQRNFKALLQQGDKGFVFFHHALASWVHTWPEYVEVMGGAADWGTPLKNIRGKDYPASGFKGKTPQHITIVDKTHPIVEGLGDGFDIVDECYLCPMFEDSVHCLARTDMKQVAENYRPAQAGHPPGSNMCVWVKAAERTPVAYVQHGHDEEAWGNPAFKTLLLNSIKWAYSKDAKDWAHQHPAKIFA